MSGIFRFLVPRNTASLSLAGALLAYAESAAAHHAMDGTAPTTFWHGLLSGLAHPIIGLDHLAYLVCLGIVAGPSGRVVSLPALFVGSMFAGINAHLVDFDFPGVEIAVGASVAIIGILLATGSAMSTRLVLGLLGAAGYAHGYALAESVVGAEPAPVFAYLIGLSAIQFAIAASVALLASGRIGQLRISPMLARGAGAAAALFGLAATAGAAGWIP